MPHNNESIILVSIVLFSECTRLENDSFQQECRENNIRLFDEAFRYWRVLKTRMYELMRFIQFRLRLKTDESILVERKSPA
jgi:hypothetical protein